MHNKTKVIYIEDLKIFKNTNKKEDSQIISYVAIMVSEYQSSRNKSHYALISSFLLACSIPSIIPTPLTSSLKTIPNIDLPKKTRSRQISKSLKQYDARMNNDIKILLSQLTEVFDIPDWGMKKNSALYSSHLDKCDSWAFFTQKIQLKDIGDLDYYAFITTNFDIYEFEIYKKVMASK